VGAYARSGCDERINLIAPCKPIYRQSHRSWRACRKASVRSWPPVSHGVPSGDFPYAVVAATIGRGLDRQASASGVVMLGGTAGCCGRASTVRITSPLAIPASSASAQGGSTAPARDRAPRPALDELPIPSACCFSLARTWVRAAQIPVLERAPCARRRFLHQNRQIMQGS